MKNFEKIFIKKLLRQFTPCTRMALPYVDYVLPGHDPL
jgi:hypothetical protein